VNHLSKYTFSFSLVTCGSTDNYFLSSIKTEYLNGCWKMFFHLQFKIVLIHSLSCIFLLLRVPTNLNHNNTYTGIYCVYVHSMIVKVFSKLNDSMILHVHIYLDMYCTILIPCY